MTMVGKNMTCDRDDCMVCDVDGIWQRWTMRNGYQERDYSHEPITITVAQPIVIILAAVFTGMLLGWLIVAALLFG